MAENFRPWGQLSWLVGKLPLANWSFLGTLGTEDRCTAAYLQLAPTIGFKRLLKILDPHIAEAAMFHQRFAEMQAVFGQGGAAAADIIEANLLQNIDRVSEIAEAFKNNSEGKIVLDISSMPKRWFFPIMRFLSLDPDVRDLIVCYSVAGRYGVQLSSDPLPLGPLPTFDQPRAEMHYDDLVVGVGFAPLGLKDLFEANIEKIRYLFPFPPGPPNYFRNWEFLRSLESEVENRNLRTEDRWQVHTYDVPDAFEALCRITNRGDRTCALAPLGPKTHSLAMCLFALALERAGRQPAHVYYTQPRRYALDYSVGTALYDGASDIKAYCVKLDGRHLYEL
jgi:hypothetical protein